MGRLLIDSELGERFLLLSVLGRVHFRDTAIRKSQIPISATDLDLISSWHLLTNPQKNDWRVHSAAVKDEQGVLRRPNSFSDQKIFDSSGYGNWDLPGGPLEHINLATQAALVLTLTLADNVRRSSRMGQQRSDLIAKVKSANPHHIAAGAGLHDEGRKLTHLFLTTEIIGAALLRKMGIRQDLLDIMPSEEVMLVPREESIFCKLLLLHPYAVILRIADEFGKRDPATKKLYQPSGYTGWDRQKWRDGYVKRDPSGRPSEQFFRVNSQLHIDNVPDYFDALDRWVRYISHLSLLDLTQTLEKELGSTLSSL